MAVIDELTTVHRRQQLALRAATLRDLQRLWPVLDFDRLDDTFPGFLAATGALIQRDRRRAAGLASRYLRAARMASGVAGEPTVVIPPPAPAEQVAASMRTTALAGYRTALRYREPQEAQRVAFVRTAGSVGRLVLNASRDTITGSLIADPQATGWQRITSAGACRLCTALAGRGAVYSAHTVDFSAHDHCACMAQPVYGGDPRQVRDFAPSSRFRTEEQRAPHRQRTRDWLASL